MKPTKRKVTGGRVLSTPTLVSTFVVCIVIIGLCIWQAIELPKDQLLYISLAFAALAYGIFIVVMNQKNKKRLSKR